MRSSFGKIFMHHQTQYSVTPDLQAQAAKQMFIAVFVKKKWIGVLMFYIISIFTLIFHTEFGWVPFAIFGSITFILTSMWIKTYLKVQENAKTYLRTISDPTTQLIINDQEMQISNSNGMRRLTWDTVDRFVSTRDFVIPMTGNVPLICLPKSELTTEVIDWLASHRK
jgi:hypothetical protein